MAACADQELLLGALVDGELDAANTALAEAHVARCEHCREELERLEALRRMVRGEGVRHLAPDDLRTRIRTLRELAPKVANSSRELPKWLGAGFAGALAASLAMVAFVNPVQRQSAIDGQLVSSHVRSLQPGHLTDVQTTIQHIVKPWFNGKVDFAPPVPELAKEGFPLAGGRLDSIDGKTVAAIVYHRRLHTINLFVWRSEAAPSKVAVEDGYSLVEWSEGGLNFAAVSDIPRDELRLFRDLYRRQSGLAQGQGS